MLSDKNIKISNVLLNNIYSFIPNEDEINIGGKLEYCFLISCRKENNKNIYGPLKIILITRYKKIRLEIKIYVQ